MAKRRYISKSFTVEEKMHALFRKECDKRAISVSKWLRNTMKKQLEVWKVNINVRK